MRILRHGGLNLYLLMGQRAVPNTETGKNRETQQRTQRKQKDEQKYDLEKQTPPQIQWTNRQQQHLKQRGHLCLHRVACCGWTTGTGHIARHTQTKVTGCQTVLQWQYFN